jgi:cytochrome c553
MTDKSSEMVRKKNITSSRGPRAANSAVKRALALSLAIAGVGFGPCQPDAVAQTAMAGPDELRPLYATPEDIAEGKQLAHASCADCHGPDGISQTPAVPNLAGQRPSYLYRVLKAYQIGGHPGTHSLPAMQQLKFVSDSALVNLAAYYGSLQPAQPAAAAASAAPYVDPVAAGRIAAAACVGCHGATGVSKTPGTPNLTGLAPQYLVVAMNDYKNGRRQNDTMKAVVASLTDVDMNHLALFFALQKAARAQTPAEGDAAAGKAAAVGCAGCHGDNGISVNPADPSMAGQDWTYLVEALRSYKNGTRADQTMKDLVNPLDDAAMKNLAAYYSGLEPQRPNVSPPPTPEALAQVCDRCHGVNGNSTQVNIPALAGQRMSYLEAALHAYQTGARKNSDMNAMAKPLSSDEITGLAAYYSRKKPRAVVFVPVPAK